VASSPAAAQQLASDVVLDRDLTVASGASISAAIGEVVAHAEEHVVPDRLFAEEGGSRRTANVAYRIGKHVLFDAPQEYMLLVFDHELFGHGARLRERFDGPIGYQFSVPSPYGGGGASTNSVLDREPSPHEALAIHVGGMEADAVAADLVAARALSRGRMTPRDAMRYLEFELDTLSYVWSTDDEGEGPGHDVFDFLEAYNELASGVGASTLSTRTLKRQALVGLANPMLAYAAWGIGRYIATGATDVAVPMLTVAGVRYLPLFRYRLTPFGTEWAVVNELGGRVRAMRVEFRVGRALDARPWGIAVRQRELSVWREWTVGLAGAVWHQPKFAESADEPFPPPTQFGVHVRGRLERPLIPVWFSTNRATLIVDVGVKSAGFVPGEPLGGGVVARAGVGIPFAR